MIKRKLYILIISVIIYGTINAQSTLLNQTEKQISIEFALPEISINSVHIEDDDFAVLTFDESRTFLEAGRPIIPYVITRVAIPAGASVSSQYNIIEQAELNGLNLMPAIYINDLQNENRLQLDEGIYKSAAPYPGDIVQVSDPYTYRLMRVVDIKIYPVQYHPSEKRVRLLKKLTIQLQLRNGTVTANPNRFSGAEKNILQQRLLNFDQAANWATPRRTSLQLQGSDYDFSFGEWFKIPITEEGIYEISGSFLQSQNVDISSVDVSTIQMFSHDGKPLSINVNTPRPEGLNEIAIEVRDSNNNGILDSNEKILFFARAIEGWDYNSAANNWEYYINPYSSTNYVLLTFNQKLGKRINITASANLSNAVKVNEFTDHLYFFEDQYNILQSGLDWYWERFQGTAQQGSIDFELPQNIVPDNAQFTIKFKGGSGARYFDTVLYRYTLDVSLNNASVAQNVTFTSESTKTVSTSTSALRGGSNALQINYTGNREGCYMFLDYFEIALKRPFIAENNYLKIFHEANANPIEFSVSGLPGGTNRVWDVTNFADVEAITPLANGSTTRFQQVSSQGTGGRQFYVFGDAAVKPVELIERLENSPNLRDPSRKGRMLLITADEFYEAAQAWEDLKETQFPNPIQVERVKVSEIYREFSSGVPDPTAIRDFIKYAYENWGANTADPAANRPIYVQILGDGSYDYRNIELTEYLNRVPVFEITANNDIDSRVTDNFFTAINNTSNGTSRLDPQLAIARFPANSIGDIENYIRKMGEYANAFQNPNELKAGWQTTLTFVADDECAGSSACNEWFHLAQTEKIIKGNSSKGFLGTPNKFEFSKIYLVDYETVAGGLGRQKPGATRALLEQINRGTLIINFFGHGDPNTWAHEQVLTKARDLPLIKDDATLPLWIAATCTWGQYDDPNVPSMAEEMTWSKSGGIASLAASRPTFAFQNLDFVEDLFRQLFHNKDDNQRSRLVGDAMNIAITGQSNDQKYHLFGDVALQLADPENVIKIDHISRDTLKALSRVSVDASVVDKNGNLLSNFNGKALIRVFDSVDSLRKLGTNYVYQGGTIFKGVVSVKNGKIEDASFIVPKSIKYQNSTTGRISIYAWSDESKDAVGYRSDLLFLGSASQISDAEGPEIRFSFPEQPDFFDGDYIRQQAELVIELSDVNGINLTGEVGHKIELIVDGNIKKDVTDFFVYNEDSYSEGKLRYTLPAMAAGQHTLTINAWDNLNNFNEKQVTFTTASAQDLTIANVVNYPNPFEDETTFTFQFQSPNGIADATIKVYTVTGRLIRQIEDFARPGFNKIPWDGRDEDGNLLANGVYLYKIVINDGEKTIEKIDKLAITR